MNKPELLDLIIKIDNKELTSEEYPEVNKKLLPLGLARWQEDTLVLTEKAKALLFQCKCKVTMNAIAKRSVIHWPEGVQQWLLRHEFIMKAEKGNGVWLVTLRGKDWLSQIE